MANINFRGPKKWHPRVTQRAWNLARNNNRWARRQNRRNWRRNRPIIKNMRALMDDQMANAEETGQRYRDVIVPYEDQHRANIAGYQGKVDEFSSEVAKLKQQAEEYGSEANREFMMGRAQASVGDAFEKGREQVLAQLESRGINPAATRYAGMDYGVRTAEAAAKAAAGTHMGLTVDETSRAMFNEALTREAQARGLDLSVLGLEKGMVDVGRTYPALELAQQAGAGASGQGAMGGQLATSEQGRNLRGSANDFMQSLNDSISGWTDTLNAEATADLKQQEIDAASSSGVGGIIGSVLPFVQKFIPGFQEGGPVPESASPSGGAIPDDVTAKVSSGEFVFPENAVRFYGTDKLQKMIDKVAGGVTADRGTAGAAMEPAIPEDASAIAGFPALPPPAPVMPQGRLPLI